MIPSTPAAAVSNTPPPKRKRTPTPFPFRRAAQITGVILAWICGAAAIFGMGALMYEDGKTHRREQQEFADQWFGECRKTHNEFDCQFMWETRSRPK